MPMLQLLHIRSASNPMDKGVCNSVNSEIQTWLPCTIIKVKLGYYVEAHARIYHVSAAMKRIKLWKQSPMARWRNSSTGLAGQSFHSH